MKRIDDYIIYLTEQIFDYKFRTFQIIAAKKIIKSIVNAEMEEVPLNWSRQVGKTDTCKIVLTLAIFLPLLAAATTWSKTYPKLHRFKKGFKAAFVAPLEWQAKIPLKKLSDEFVMNPRLDSALQQLGVTKMVDNTKEMAFDNGSRIDIHTANAGAGKPAGTYDLLWFTEAQALSTYAIRSIFSPTLASTQGTKVFDGTAESFRNDFYDVIQREKARNPKDKSITITYDIAAKEVPGYLDYVDTELPRIAGGKQSPFFAMNYLLQWVGGGGSLIGYEGFEDCYGNFQRNQLTMVKDKNDIWVPDSSILHCIGLDFAKVKDKTIGCHAEFHPDHFKIVDWFETWQLSHTEQNDLIVEWILNKGLTNVFLSCDSTGIGDARVDDLRDKLSYQIMPLAYTAKLKDQMYKLFNQYTSNLSRKVQWYRPQPGDNEFASFERESLDCVVEARGNDLFNWHAKTVKGEDQISEPHDDYVSALMNVVYAFENYSPTGGIYI